MRLVVAINDRCTITYCARRPIVRSIVATDRTINRDDRRPIVRSIVASCDRSYEQSWHPVTERTINRGTRPPIVRSIVGWNDRSHDATIDLAIDRCDLQPIVDQSWQSWHQTTDRTINRSIARPMVRSTVRVPILGNRTLQFLNMTIDLVATDLPCRSPTTSAISRRPYVLSTICLRFQIVLVAATS